MAKYLAKVQARELRKQGISIPKIAKLVKATASSVSCWVKDISLTRVQIDQLKSEKQFLTATRNKQEKVERQQRYGQVGQQKIGDPQSIRELFLVGAALYWGEGNKTRGTVAVANSDPAAISLFIKWLHTCFNVPTDKMKIILNIHEDMDHQAIEKYWKRVTGFADCQFYKTQVARNTVAKIKKKQSYRGTATVIVHNANLAYEIQGILEKLRHW